MRGRFRMGKMPLPLKRPVLRGTHVPPAMKKNNPLPPIHALVATLVLCLAVGGGAVFVLLKSRPAKSPYFGQYDASAPAAYDFQLTDQNAAPWRLKDQRGNVVLLSFGFTRCANICPTTLANLAAICRLLPPEAQARVRVIFISLDERDAPSVLKNYVPFFNERFIGLTGAPGDIGKVACAYGASYRKAPAVSGDKDDYMIDHSTYTTLIDPEGKSRLLYRFEQMPDSPRIANDILRVLDMPPLATAP